MALHADAPCLSKNCLQHWKIHETIPRDCCSSIMLEELSMHKSNRSIEKKAFFRKENIFLGDALGSRAETMTSQRMVGMPAA